MGLRYVGAKATLCCVKSNSSDRSGVRAIAVLGYTSSRTRPIL